MAARITVLFEEPIGYINPELHGHFSEHLGSCITEGIWVGERSRIANDGGIRSDVVAALRKIRPPVLRWPGGCYADDYHWEDGIGPREQRPRRVNIWWGQSIEDNQFGTHEFLRLCDLIGARPYLAGNLGSGTVREMRDWVEYCNFAGDSELSRRRRANGAEYPFNVRYWGVGNENWGCGGNFCPEDYATEYRRYATYLRDFGESKLFLIACGPNGNDLEWTRRFFKKFGRPDHFGNARIHGYAAHYYCGTAGTATQYSVDQWYELLHKSLFMRQLITEQRSAMDEFDPQRRIGLIIDEWGTWHPPTPGRNPQHLWQQNTIRDALVAALTLNLLNEQADKVVMANIAQTVNVLQAMCLTQGEALVLTPTYHVFDLYQSHQGGQSLRTIAESGASSFVAGQEKRSIDHLHASASLSQGKLTLSVVNTHASLPVDAALDLRGRTLRDVSVRVLADEDIAAHNTFAEPQRVQPKSVAVDEELSRITLPPASVTVIGAQIT
jgi:alpha-L-arabinofuranosidase